MSGDSENHAGATFSSLLLSEFSFLAELGFDVEAESADAVTWKRGDRSLLISRDWRDGFVDTHLADASAGHAFGLRQALAAIGRHDLMPEHGWQAREVATQRRYAEELARLVSVHLVRFLEAPASQWATANQLLLDEAEAHTREIQSRQLRASAQVAREAQNWRDVDAAYRLLTRQGFELTPTERARWDQARRFLDRDST